MVRVKGRRGLANTGLIVLAAAVVVISACGGDDGATVREIGDSSESVSAVPIESGSAAASGSASASGPAAASTSAPSTSEGASTPADGGYEYASNVDSHRLVVAGICGIGDLLDAGDFAAVEDIYRNGKNSVTSDGSIRTIGDFAARDGRSHGLDAYYGTPAPLDKFVTAALRGTGMFEGQSNAVRGQGAEKGIQNQVMVAWTIHELYSAIGKATGNKRGGDFGTVGADGETARANEAILAAMIAGRDALLASDAAGAEAAADKVLRNLAITYSQAAIRYASLIEADLADGNDAKAREHQAEGLAFWRVVEAYMVPAGADAQAMDAIFSLDNPPGTNGFGDQGRAALQPALDALGIANDIGSLQ